MVELKKSMVKNHQNTSKTVKFLCSYGGKILPRSSDGQLRYVGGVIRVLSVDRSVSFAELLVKLGELCGSSVILRCQLPTEDLDALISVTSNEDLANIIEEYDIASQAAAASSSLKIRAFLFPPKSLKKISPPPSMYGGGSPTGIYSSSSQPLFVGCFGGKKMARNHRFFNQNSTTTTTTTTTAPTTTPLGYPVGFEKSNGAMVEQYYGYISQGSPTSSTSSSSSRPPMYHHHHHLLHNGNHWQEPYY